MNTDTALVVLRVSVCTHSSRTKCCWHGTANTQAVGNVRRKGAPFTLIHSPLLNERIGAKLEPHPEMWIAVGFLVGGIWVSWDGDGGPLRYCGSPRSQGGRG